MGRRADGVIHKYSPDKIDCEAGMVELDPNHSHFILVDNGVEGEAAIGSEMRVRSGLEEEVCKANPLEEFLAVPMVLLVVGGNWSTYRSYIVRYLRQMAVITPYAPRNSGAIRRNSAQFGATL